MIELSQLLSIHYTWLNYMIQDLSTTKS